MLPPTLLTVSLFHIILADSKAYAQNDGLHFWTVNELKYPLSSPLAQDLLSAPASEAYVERVFSVCLELTAGKRNLYFICLCILGK